MKTKPPPGRRKFADERDQINYLYDKLLYWLYQREDKARARAFAERLVFDAEIPAIPRGLEDFHYANEVDVTLVDHENRFQIPRIANLAEEHALFEKGLVILLVQGRAGPGRQEGPAQGTAAAHGYQNERGPRGRCRRRAHRFGLAACQATRPDKGTPPEGRQPVCGLGSGLPD